MAAAAPDTTKPVEEMVKSSKLVSSLKLGEATLAAHKEGALSDATSCISSVDATCSNKESELDQESFGSEHAVYYPMADSYACYYPGFNSYSGWDNQSYCLGSDGLEMQQEVVQQDNGSFVYYMPGYQLGYDPYNAFMSGSIAGVDGQHVAQQPYVQSSIVSQPCSSPAYFHPTIAYGPDMIPVYGWDPSFWNAYSGSGLAEANMPAQKPKFSSKSHASKPTPKTKTNFPTETKGHSPALELPKREDIPKQSLKPVNKVSAPSKSYFPVTKVPSYAYYSYSPVSVKENGQNWASPEKLKFRNKSGGSTDFDSLDEQNRGPRTNSYRNAWTAGSDHAGMPVTDVEDNVTSKTVTVRRDEYNIPDFPTKYDHALFFVIKSYSEDDIHKSIKYNVWASTSNGNKRLDSAFQAAQEKMKEKGSKCPVFLFFSVNASGQFCGVAEMIGRVDFDKSMDFWQQDKWSGYFPVKWHIVKDVPNPQFRHIVLENNDNKPVTNSRDTQEVKFSQGTEMLNIFKNFSSKTSILDDFGFYENRQKVMQDKRSKISPAAARHLFPKNNEPVEQPRKIDAVKAIASSLEALELDSVSEKKADLDVAVC